jgi:hypothetical protein
MLCAVKGRRSTARLICVLAAALCLTLIASGCGHHESTTTVEEGVVPSTAERVYIATALACTGSGSDSARFAPLVVRGPGYATTIDPTDACRKQSSGPETQGAGPPPWNWHSYLYIVPMPAQGEVRLTPGNQPTVTLNAARFTASQAATVYYVNCSDYYTDCPPGPGFEGRVSSIEYFKDDDVQDAP